MAASGDVPFMLLMLLRRGVCGRGVLLLHNFIPEGRQLESHGPNQDACDELARWRHRNTLWQH